MAADKRLRGVHPDLIEKVGRILLAMETLGHPMIVVSGLRTDAEQASLYAQGRTKPGKIVTNLDGVTKRSNHQSKADGWGHAVDMAFLRNGKPSWAEDHPWELYGLTAESLGLTWGGRWKKLVDRPHIELV